MPAFDSALTPEERWDLVARVRDLQDNPVNATPTP
jgi:hypothetical protein